MAIDRVHWKVGDWVLIETKGFRQIEALDDEGVAITHDGKLIKYPYSAVSFRGVAESKDWKRGDIVYVDGVTAIRAEYIRHEPWGCVDYVEWDGDWNCAHGNRLTSKPLDPVLVERARKRDERLEFEGLASKIADLTDKCPSDARRWLLDMLEAFETDFEMQLRGEKHE